MSALAEFETGRTHRSAPTNYYCRENDQSYVMPITLAMGLEAGHLDRDQNVALLGIGSGINSLMLALDWQQPAERAGIDQAPHVVRHPAFIAR